LRKKRKADSDDEAEEDPQTLQERIDDARALIKNRAKAKVRSSPTPAPRSSRSCRSPVADPSILRASLPSYQGVGADSLAVGDERRDVDDAAAPEPAAPSVGLRPGGAMAGAFSAGVEADPDAEDPAMMRFVEDELAKRRAAEGGGAVDAADRAARDSNPSAAERNDGGGLWETPANLASKRADLEEAADRMMTGIVEVQLPTEYKVRNVEATERAKRMMLEARESRRHRGGDARGSGLDGPAERFGSGPAVASVSRRDFATSFGKGGGAREGWGSRARERAVERDDGGLADDFKIGGAAQRAFGGRSRAVASDDIVFKKWMNNEKKKMRR